MSGLGTICQELRAVDGVVGAFVLEHNRCVASSLPSQYDINRLSRIGKTLLKMQRVALASGFGGQRLALNWQGASLLAWVVGEEVLLGLLASPESTRETIELGARRALQELVEISPQRAFEQEAPTRPNHARPLGID